MDVVVIGDTTELDALMLAYELYKAQERVGHLERRLSAQGNTIRWQEGRLREETRRVEAAREETTRLEGIVATYVRGMQGLVVEGMDIVGRANQTARALDGTNPVPLQLSGGCAVGRSLNETTGPCDQPR